MSVSDSEEVRAALAALKPWLTEEYHVSELGIFGSYARSEQTEGSDLDILVEFAEPVSLFDLVRLEDDLAAELGMEVDVVTKKSLKPRVRNRVTEDIVYVSSLQLRKSSGSPTG